jgi:hypothetical protein
MAVVGADGLIKADEEPASSETRGELPILADIGVVKAAGVADDVGSQLALKVNDVGEMLRIRRKNVDGELLMYTKTRRKRSVPFTGAAIREDIVEYQLATGIRRGLLFPRADSEPWRKHDYSNWRQVYQPIARQAGLPQPRPTTCAGRTCRSRRRLNAWRKRTSRWMPMGRDSRSMRS